MPDSTETSPEDADGGPSRRRQHGAVFRFVNTIWHEIAKFGLIGALAFVIDIGGMNLLTHTVLGDKPTTARILSGVAATLFAWFGNRSWTFAHRRSRPMHHEVTMFFLVNGLALLISTLCLVISHYGLGFTSRLADNIATILGIGLGTLFRFWTYRSFVFAREPVSVTVTHDQDGQAGPEPPGGHPLSDGRDRRGRR